MRLLSGGAAGGGGVGVGNPDTEIRFNGIISIGISADFILTNKLASPVSGFICFSNSNGVVKFSISNSDFSLDGKTFLKKPPIGSTIWLTFCPTKNLNASQASPIRSESGFVGWGGVGGGGGDGGGGRGSGSSMGSDTTTGGDGSTGGVGYGFGGGGVRRVAVIVWIVDGMIP
jgi:hypothetical protein